MIDYIEVFEGEKEIIEVSSSRTGRAATVAIGVITTGAPGTSASVTNSGTAGEAVLDFTIPTGENVELRINGGYIQWKTTEAETWNNLIEIADITATIDIGTVITGDADTDVSVINSGSGKDAVFNISIPKGTTFTPSVSAEGVISFTNDGGLANPSSVDITGPQGIQGDPAPNTIFQYSVNGTDWTTVATGAHWYRQSGDNGVTWSEAIKLTITDYVDGKISQTITEGVEDKAPSEAAVFDALGLKAPLASPALSGTPTTPTPAPGTTTTQIVNAEFVDDEFGARAKTTSTASKIPIADENGKLESAWIKDASATVKGVVELATDAEVIQGTDTERAVTPAGLLAGFPTRLRSNLLGTVSQTGGVPTGAVIERGSNANGEYVRFADGTLLMSCIVTALATNNGSTGTNFTLPTGVYTNSSSVAATSIGLTSGGLATRVIEIDRVSGTTFRAKVMTIGPTGDFIASDDTSLSIFVYGRWF